jgi:hypothetical protein
MEHTSALRLPAPEQAAGAQGSGAARLPFMLTDVAIWIVGTELAVIGTADFVEVPALDPANIGDRSWVHAALGAVGAEFIGNGDNRAESDPRAVIGNERPSSPACAETRNGSDVGPSLVTHAGVRAYLIADSGY